MKIFNWIKRNKNKVCIDFGTSMDLTDLPVVTFYQNDTKLNFLLDTGSTTNIINSTVLDKIDSKETKSKNNVFGMDGISHSCSYYFIDIDYKGFQCSTYFMSHDMSTSFNNIKKETGVTIHGILGSKFFKKYKSIIDFNEMKAYFKK